MSYTWPTIEGMRRVVGSGIHTRLGMGMQEEVAIYVNRTGRSGKFNHTGRFLWVLFHTSEDIGAVWNSCKLRLLLPCHKRLKGSFPVTPRQMRSDKALGSIRHTTYWGDWPSQVIFTSTITAPENPIFCSARN